MGERKPIPAQQVPDCWTFLSQLGRILEVEGTAKCFDALHCPASAHRCPAFLFHVHEVPPASRYFGQASEPRFRSIPQNESSAATFPNGNAPSINLLIEC